MDATEFYGLEATDDPMVWRLPVSPGVCSNIGALFGGAGLGAAMLALEHSTARPVVWASAQFLSFALAGSVVELHVTEVVRGRYTSQSRVSGRVGGEEILTVNAATGSRESPYAGTWAVMPSVPPPLECPVRTLDAANRAGVVGRFEGRLAEARRFDDLDGTPGTGHAAVWVRMPDIDVTRATLAVIGDYVPFGISQALGAHLAGNSLDNTLRIAHEHPDVEWILASVHIDAIAGGFGHGVVHLWAEDGTLLGVASQSTIVRPIGTPPAAERSRT